jgi:hypothetical protein
VGHADLTSGHKVDGLHLWDMDSEEVDLLASQHSPSL